MKKKNEDNEQIFNLDDVIAGHKADLALALGCGIGGDGEVAAGDEAFGSHCGVVYVIFGVAVVVALEICAVALRVDHAEIGAESGRLLESLEESLELRHILAVGECVVLDVSVAGAGPALCGADVHVVRHGVHDAEACGIDSAPNALGFGDAGSDDSHEVVLLALDEHHHILPAAGIAVLPHNGTSVFGHFTGDDDAGAGFGYVYIRKEENEERKRCFDEF